jgi:hypothetical protein
MNLDPRTGMEQLDVRREIEAIRRAAVERHRDTPGQQMHRRAAAMRDVAFYQEQRRAS